MTISKVSLNSQRFRSPSNNFIHLETKVFKKSEKIKRIFFEYKERYGSPRIAKKLKEQGITCSKNRVCRLMKQERLMPKARRKFKVTTNSEKDQVILHNNSIHLKRQNKKHALVEREYISYIQYETTPHVKLLNHASY